MGVTVKNYKEIFEKRLNGVDRLTYIVNDLDLITKFESVQN